MTRIRSITVRRQTGVRQSHTLAVIENGEMVMAEFAWRYSIYDLANPQFFERYERVA